MRKMNLLAATLGVAALALVGCGDKPDHDHDKDKDGKAKSGDAGGGGTDKGTVKDGHGHEHTGEAHDLGNVDLGDGYTMKVTQRGDAPVGGEAILECMIELPKGKDVKAVKAWLGDAAGLELSQVVNADKHGDGDFDAHIQLPKEIASGAKYWVEATFADGKKRKGSWARK